MKGVLLKKKHKKKKTETNFLKITMLSQKLGLMKKKMSTMILNLYCWIYVF
jgi:hypothetical protein